MKKIIFILAAAAAICSCGESPVSVSEKGCPVIFSVDDSQSRAAHNYTPADYFGLGGDFNKAAVKTGGKTVTYIYDGGLLKPASADDGLYFPPDGSPIASIEIIWPANAQTEVVKDQSLKVDFMSADILTAGIYNVKAAEMIPVIFGHSNAKLTFVVNNLPDQRIESLEIGEYKAYCDPTLNIAQLIYSPESADLPDGTVIKVKLEGMEARELTLPSSPDGRLSAGGNLTIPLTF